MKVQHKRSGNVAEVISNNGKRVVVRDVAKNEETELAISTYKRWWKKIDDVADEQTKEAIETVKKMPAKEVVETVEKVIKKGQVKKDIIEDDKCGDGTPLAEVSNEIFEQAKQKVKKSKEKLDKSKKSVKSSNPCDMRSDKDALSVSISNYLNDNGYTVNVNSKKHLIEARCDSKKPLHIYIGAKKFVIMTTIENAPKNIKANRVRDMKLAYSFDMSYSKLEDIKLFM